MEETAMWPDLAGRFAQALITPSRPVPDAIVGEAARFAIYRNNVAVGLRDSLAATYPVVASLVGEAFFAEMARAFVAAEPPMSPILIEYGGGFADFIDRFRPADDLPYLSDVARLEWAWQESYHAADAAPVDIQILASVDPTELDGIRFIMHPSVRLLRSRWPVASIWEAHQQDVPDLSAIVLSPENALIVRPQLTVATHLLDEGAGAMVEMLMQGEPLGRAIDHLNDLDQETDFSACLTALFAVGAVVGIR